MAVFGLFGILGLCAFGATCSAGSGEPGDGDAGSTDDAEQARRIMVSTQVERRGVRDPVVLDAMRRVPRHLFVPEAQRPYAYVDAPRPIGHDQTISQPYIVALMTSLIEPKPSMKVLEIGTGSGYQAAILAECVKEVYTIEIIPALGRRAEVLLDDLGYDNVHVRIGDGFAGWPEQAPFDAIVVTAAPTEIPKPLEEQLAPGGRLVIPVGRYGQELVRVTRTEDGLRREEITPVRFVPMTGRAQEED